MGGLHLGQPFRRRDMKLRRAAAVGQAAVLVLGAATTGRAALLAHYEMDAAAPLANTAPGGPYTYQPNMTDSAPAPAAVPTYLPTGGVNGSGAYQFDGVDDYMNFIPT